MREPTTYPGTTGLRACELPSFDGAGFQSMVDHIVQLPALSPEFLEGAGHCSVYHGEALVKSLFRPDLSGFTDPPVTRRALTGPDLSGWYRCPISGAIWWVRAPTHHPDNPCALNPPYGRLKQLHEVVDRNTGFADEGAQGALPQVFPTSRNTQMSPVGMV